MALGTAFVGFPLQVGPVSKKTSRWHAGGGQVVMATPAGTVKCELKPVLFSIGSPVEGLGIDENIVKNVGRACDGLGGQVLDEVPVRQMAVDALSGKSLWIFPAMNRILPGSPERSHDVAADTERIRIGRFHHEPGSQDGYNRQQHADPGTDQQSFFSGCFLLSL